MENINKIIDKNFDEEVEFLQKIISFNTVYDFNNATDEYPFGKNISDCLDYVLERSEELGFITKNIDNMVGYSEIGDKDGDLYGILCHLDTVPYNNLDNWKAHPTSGAIIDNEIIGRGAIDNKGSVAATFYAIKALLENGVKLNKRFRVILGLDEETEFRCVDRYLNTEDIPKYSYAPDAKFPAVYGEKGILRLAIKRKFEAMPMEPVILLGMTAGEKVNVVPDKAIAYFGGKDIAKIYIQLEKFDRDYIKFDYFEDKMIKLEIEGKAVHAMNPQKGANAIQRLFGVLEKLDFAPKELNLWIKDMYQLFKYETDGKLLGIVMTDEISTPLTVNLGILRYDSEELQANFDIRYPVTINPEYAEDTVCNAMKKTGTAISILNHKQPLYADKNSPFVKTLLNAYQSITGDKSEPVVISGGTYARAFPNTLAFGPNMPTDEDLAHQSNERISLLKLKTITKIYAKAIFDLNVIEKEVIKTTKIR